MKGHMGDIITPDRTLAWGTRGTAGATFAGNIAFENVSYAVGDLQILHSLTFSLSPGEVVCLLGPSGCGKTSLLRLAAGVSKPTSGRILIDGVEVSGPARFEPPEKRNVGLMFQDFALFPHMTVIENVAYGLYALKRTEALSIAERALQRVGLAKYRNSYPHGLSGGEQQRVALARAIVPRPQVMLMDEPFSGLDQRLRETVRTETLALLRETRATCIFVTHDPAEAMEISDRILLMRHGSLAQVGTPQNLYDHPVDAEAARFFTDLNEVRGTVKNELVDTPLGRFIAPGKADGACVVLMIRPNAIKRAKADGFEAFVSDRRFLGDHARLTLNVAGLDAPIYATVPASDPIASVQSARFVIDGDGILVFTSD
jgi:iron(III) transport system ATP-binding protein